MWPENKPGDTASFLLTTSGALAALFGQLQVLTVIGIAS